MQNKDKITIGQQITQCLDELKATDYKAIKYAEGELSESDYSPIREKRRQCRIRINELEKQLADEVLE
jgi:hypothetical protein